MSDRPIRNKRTRSAKKEPSSMEQTYISPDQIQKLKIAFVRKYTALLRQGGYSESTIRDKTRLSRKDDIPDGEKGLTLWEKVARILLSRGVDPAAYTYWTLNTIWLQGKTDIYPAMLLYPTYIADYVKDKKSLDETIRAEWSSQRNAFESECFSYASMAWGDVDIAQRMQDESAKKYATLSSRTPISPLFRCLKAYSLNMVEALNSLLGQAATQYIGNVAIYDDLMEEDHAEDAEAFRDMLISFVVEGQKRKGGV